VVPELATVTVEEAEPRHLAWSRGLSFLVPREVLELLGAREGRVRIAAGAPAIDPGAPGALRLRAAFTERRPASSRLPIHYHVIPAPVRMVVGRALGRLQKNRQERWASFPRWPLDLSADLLADLAGEPPSPFASGPTPLVLSHDLDSPEGLRNLVTFFLDIEEKVGARSTSFFVPRAWTLDHGLLEETRRRGHDLGIHGYDHSNKTPYCGDEERRARVEGALELKARYGCNGYRAPSLCRTRALLSELERHYEYDASIPTSGGPFPVPNNGCASARPFRIGGLWELPLSLPRDGTLRFLGHSPEEIADLWIETAQKVARSGGVAVLLTHCEERFSGGEAMRSAYAKFLERAASSGTFRFATAREVVSEAKRALESSPPGVRS